MNLSLIKLSLNYIFINESFLNKLSLNYIFINEFLLN